MSDHFHGHINRDAFEKVLRETFSNIPEEVTKGNPVLACQARAVEASVQFALFIADELNAGTSAGVLLEAGSRVIGGMVENFARGFTVDQGEDILATVLRRVQWATTSDEDDFEVVVTRPQTMGGSA
ncbi:hypothetical protein EFV37_25230 [Mesorhizobium loti]|uniref:Uncharacterized protein n=1 Tax=Mesorhizobium jarvisii TaxID=1777867 RepID=A0A6M7TKD3_9HYPH|nr:MULTISPECIES: hypothetical protein [Mesorhizobium]OBQ68379.1 hypothetical protein A9K72_08985 [Mesorhizobium loti]QKC65202.1 hypothetical protein EB229_25225 [Mesorhizobium jarvisii]QKD11117.1 hypothetical protein EFV37_25230 [Mesorhizobium loti]RJT31077.1 hypothetical protein D3242_22710 [Mesorhizobium jarvisii]